MQCSITASDAWIKTHLTTKVPHGHRTVFWYLLLSKLLKLVHRKRLYWQLNPMCGIDSMWHIFYINFIKKIRWPNKFLLDSIIHSEHVRKNDHIKFIVTRTVDTIIIHVWQQLLRRRGHNLIGFFLPLWALLAVTQPTRPLGRFEYANAEQQFGNNKTNIIILRRRK